MSAHALLANPSRSGAGAKISSKALGLTPNERQLGYAGRRAKESHTPPPINAAPDSRPNNFARQECMNHARPSPAAAAQAESVNAASTTETAHISASCGSTGRAGSTNCGKKAVKNAMLFGLDSATAKPRQTCKCPLGGAAVGRSRRHGATLGCRARSDRPRRSSAKLQTA